MKRGWIKSKMSTTATVAQKGWDSQFAPPRANFVIITELRSGRYEWQIHLASARNPIRVDWRTPRRGWADSEAGAMEGAETTLKALGLQVY